MSIWDHLGDAANNILDELHRASSKALDEEKLKLERNLDQRRQDRLAEESVDRLLSNPGGLANQPDDWLANFVITLEGEIKKLEAKIADTNKLYGDWTRGGKISSTLHDAENWGFQESIRKRQVLLEHITAVQDARKTTAQSEPEPTREQKRAAMKEEIRLMRQDKAAELDQMRKDGADEEAIRFRENGWDDAIMRKESDYAKLL